MQIRRVVIAYAIVAAIVAGLTACASQSGVQRPIQGASAGGPAAASIARAAMPNVAPTPIPLVPGMSIGVNTFPDGDTQSGGQGQTVDHLLGCHKYMSEIFHIHVHLSIFDPNGTQIMVPWAVGIVPPWTFNQNGDQVVGGTCFYNLHTHDRSGVIHDESKTDLGLTLGNFFDVWGEPLSTTNVAGYSGTVWVKIITPTQTGKWTTTIDPRSILLTEHEQISLAIGKPVIPVPKYHFTY